MRTALAAAALATALCLSACGKKGAPAPPGPPDQIVHYTYPPADPDAPAR